MQTFQVMPFISPPSCFVRYKDEQQNRLKKIYLVCMLQLSPDMDAISSFYVGLHSLLSNNKFIFGNFKQRLERDFDVCKSVHRRHGVGKCNNGHLIPEFFPELNLFIFNTLLKHKYNLRTTQMNSECFKYCPPQRNIDLLIHISSTYSLRQTDKKIQRHAGCVPWRNPISVKSSNNLLKNGFIELFGHTQFKFSI